MPKLKTKSGAKKRFKVTATGKVRAQAAFKRHCLEQKSPNMKRNARGMMTLAEPDQKIVLKNWLRNA
ncbi:LSU ribosomal protein L35P [Azospirillum brasilense]|uniref:Large ribosomal subunit protein bL35 n=3 Tax=Alphaproteobacteria TaxID=28211 RepID=A0A9W7NMN3_9PROT|nr:MULTISPECIES: 50S ribosomal protein L35 [Rhodospirillales]KAA0683005.1 50S ribosomal protein L35 [Roseomonas genomospecies 6]MBB3262843.1 large subunit ribosomal protein L35 [Azospirillum sp. OGB3]MDQ2105868.1 50S ribosomal protein L35 [Azospirillum isscasi]TWA68911.1 LSU ribosomal protein L35P [Azospirillum brasilense]